MKQEELVDTVTRVIMEQLNGTSGANASVVAFGDVPTSLMGAGVHLRLGHTPADVEGAQYIVLTQAAFRALHGGVQPAALGGVAVSKPSPAGCSTCGTATDVSLTGKKLIGDRDMRAANLAAGAVVRVDPDAILTSLAQDYLRGLGGKIVR